jgi:integrase
MTYQRGSLKAVKRKEGATWVLRHRVTASDGRRVENIMQVGLVRDFPKEKDARREVDKLGLLLRINETPCSGRIRFSSLCEQYLKNDFGADAVRPKTERTILSIEHIVRAYLVPRWGREIADDIKPLEIQRWLKSLHDDDELAWTTVSKMRGTMLRAYKVGILHELVSKNPVLPVETRCTTGYKAILVTPQQTLAIIQGLPNILHRFLVLTCAATALRFSELLALRWSDVLWEEAKIAITKRWSAGKDGPTKTRKAEGHVPLHSTLAYHLKEWHAQTPYAKETDFLFPSLTAKGSVPLSPAVFVADHLRPAALKAGVQIPEGHRFGLHNLRHSLSHWLVNKAKVEPKTVQSILRHSRIQTTLDIYTQGDGDETRAAQGTFLNELGMGSEMVQ